MIKKKWIKVQVPESSFFILIKKDGKELFRRQIDLNIVKETQTDTVALYLRVAKEVFEGWFRQ